VLAPVCPRAHAETLGEVVNPRKANRSWVSDMARVIDASTEAKLNSLLASLERRTTAEMAVVTIRSTDGSTPKQFATRLFNRWGIGKRAKDNGVLMLVVMDARRMEVETGNGMESILPNARVQMILEDEAVPFFKNDEYGAGILAGVEVLAQDITRLSSNKAGAAPLRSGKPGTTTARPNTSQSTPRPESRPGSQSRPANSPGTSSYPTYTDSYPSRQPGGFGWVPYVLGFLGLSAAGVAVAANSNRKCQKCGQNMRRLNETEDDVALAADQKFEEELGSVDYRVWVCDACGTSKVERAPKLFSPYRDCPKCAHRTLSSQERITRHPTYDFTGESIVTRGCRFPGCNYRDQFHKTLPPRPRPTPPSHHGISHSGISHSSSHSSGGGSSGSSGGSFGGGSSSGGGAGASW
jgi:uncharacterized protein